MKKSFFIFLLIAITIDSICQDKRPDNFILKKDILFTNGDTLKADIYLPSAYKKQKNPVLIFANSWKADYRQWEHYMSWAKFAAEEGFVSIVYQSRENESQAVLKKVLDFVEGNAAQYAVDLQRITLYGASGNAPFASSFANEEKRIRAAVIYYGFSDIKTFRVDLPVLIIRAGFDNASLNRSLDSLAFRALQANAPYTISNFNSGNHPFEDINNPEIAGIMKATLNYLLENTRLEVQQRLNENENQILANRELYRGDWNAAIKYFETIIKKKPGENTVEQKIGNAYMELKEYNKALAYLDSALLHGNWRKGEIAKQKCIAYAALNLPERAVNEMKKLKEIGWFKKEDYESESIFKSVVVSEPYKNFLSMNQQQ